MGAKKKKCDTIRYNMAKENAKIQGSNWFCGYFWGKQYPNFSGLVHFLVLGGPIKTSLHSLCSFLSFSRYTLLIH